MANCRACLKPVDVHCNVDDEQLQPQKGDVSVCMYCGTVSVYDYNLKLVQPTYCDVQEMKTVGIWRQILSIQKLINEKIRQQ
jgi:hypothetical protein